MRLLNRKSIEDWKKEGLSYHIIKQEDVAAIECYDNALKINPNEIDILRLKADSLSEIGEFNDAIEIYNKIINIDANNYASYISLGEAYHNLGHRYLKDSLENFQKSVELKETKISYNGIGKINYIYENYEESLKFYNKSLSVDLNDKGIFYTFALVGKGNTLQMLNRFEEANECYDIAYDTNDNAKLEVIPYKLMCLDRLKDYSNIVNVFETNENYLEDNLNFLVKLSKILEHSMIDRMKIILKIVNHINIMIYSYFLTANAYNKLNKNEEASKIRSRAMDLAYFSEKNRTRMTIEKNIHKMVYGSTLLTKTILLNDKGKYDEALESFNNALNYYPGILWKFDKAIFLLKR